VAKGSTEDIGSPSGILKKEDCKNQKVRVIASKIAVFPEPLAPAKPMTGLQQRYYFALNAHQKQEYFPF
jgi:hypothetical protein